MKLFSHPGLTPTELVWFHRVVGLALWGVASMARADVFGQNLLNWAAPIFAGLGIIALVGGLALAMFNPRMAAMAVASAFVCGLIFFIIHNSQSLSGVLQQP